MKNFDHYTHKSVGLTALLAITLLTGCGGGEWNSNPTTETETETEIAVAPTVTDTSPDDEAIDVAIATAVNVSFSAAMDASTIDDTTFTLTGPADTAVAGAVSYSADNMTATFVPTNDLEFDTNYSAVVSIDIRNATGQALASNHVWTFTTGAGTFITTTESNPVAGGTEVCTNKSISAVFSDALEPSSIESPALTFTLAETLNTFDVEGLVTLDATNTIATFTPNMDLDPDLEYTATITTDVEDVNGNSLEEDSTWSFTTNTSYCQQTITLGATEPYGVLSNTGVTLGGGPASVTGFRVDGDVGIFPAGACIGCDSTTVTGVLEIGTTAAQNAINALEAAYIEARDRAVSRCTLINSGALTTNPSATCGGSEDGIFAPGLYWSSTSIAIPAGGTITLDGGNDNDAVFIFQSESTIDTIGGDTHMILQNGAQAKNVFWIAKSSATIGGTNSDFAGTILALIGITVNTGTDMVGRALARGAEVTVQDQALITVPAE